MQGVADSVVGLYSSNASPQEAHAIQLRLQEVQQSPEAWGLVQPLLEHPDPNVRFFAASTLAVKVARDWASLPPEQHDALRASCLGWLARSAGEAYPGSGGRGRDGERVVMRKLAGATAGLSLRLDGWRDWLLEVLMRVAAGGAGREAVLEVLEVSIETVTRADLVGATRLAYMATLTSSTQHIVTSLAASLTSNSVAEVNQALQCFNAALLAGLLHHHELETLYPLLLPHLSNAETSLAACAAVEELVERSSGVQSGGAGTTRFIGRAKAADLVSGWATTACVHEVVASAIAEEEPSDDALAVMRLVTALSEHFVPFLFSPPPTGSGVPTLSLRSPETQVLFRLVLAITTFPGHSGESYNVTELATGVWNYLQEECADVGLVWGTGEGREGRPGREHEWEAVEPVFVALANGLRERATFPAPGVVATWPKDVLDAFRVYRTTVLEELLLYASYILRDSMLGGLVNLGAQQLYASTEQSNFSDLEATFFCVSAIRDSVSESEAVHLPMLFGPSILGRLPTTGFITFRRTALRMVGEYATWFGDQPAACLQAVSFVVAGLSEVSLCPQAARALRLLCKANRKSLGDHVGSFVAVLGGLDAKVDDSELIKVLESVASVVQALPVDRVVDPLLTLTAPIIAKLQSSVDAFAQLPTEARDLCLQQLSYLTACAKGLSDPEDDLVDLDASFDDSPVQKDTAARILGDPRVAEMRAHLSRAIEGTAMTWPADVEVVQALADFLKHSSSDAIPSAVGLEPLALLSLTTGALQASMSPVWLSISGSLVARVARSEADSLLTDEQLAAVGKPIEAALNAVLQSHSDLTAMDENPELVQAFLSFANAVVRNFPRVLAALPNHLDAVIAFAERGLGMQERFSLKATIDVLMISIQQTRMASSSSVVFRQTLLEHARPILSSLIVSIGGGVPRSQLTSLSELLHVCILRLPNETRGLLQELLAAPGWPTPQSSAEAKTKFLKAVLSARTGKLVRAAVGDFAIVCRGLEGTTYGAASASVFE